MRDKSMISYSSSGRVVGLAVAHIVGMVIPLRDWLILRARMRRFIPVVSQAESL